MKYLFILIPSICLAQRVHNVQIFPIDFSGENLDYAPADMAQLESSGEKIYVRGLKNEYVTVFDRSGKMIGSIGRQGGGPGEIGKGVLAMAVRGDHLWVQDASNRKKVNHYLDGKFIDTVTVHSYNISVFRTNTNVFAVSDSAIVYPASPRTKHLAHVYFHDGRRKDIGNLYFDAKDVGLLEKAPGMNDTNWVYDSPFFYCLFRFYPMVLKFGEDFEKVDAFALKNGILQELFEKGVLDFEPTAKMRRAQPLFYDFKVRAGFLYLMAKKNLFKVDAQTGEITDIYRFFGVGEAFPPNTFLNFYTFTVLNDRTLILAANYLWDHDLWRTKPLP